VTVEAGARGRRGALEYSAAGFVGRVRDAIVQSGEIGGRAFFRNAGRVRQDGVELGISLRAAPIATLRAAYTFAAYRFAASDEAGGGDLAGSRLPGVPRHFAQVSLGLAPGDGVRVEAGHTFSSDVAADDRNTIVVPGWGLGVTDVRVSWGGRVGSFLIMPVVGLNNVFDRAYVGSVTINGFGGRVIEPAPGRNGYLGMEVRYPAR
jgi:iron complex outermembrane receptor protein